MMNFILWLFVGAGLGWLTTAVIHNRKKDLLINILVGMVGAFVAAYLVTPLLQVNPINQGIIRLPELWVAVAGAVVLLAIVNFFRREADAKNSLVERKWELVRNKMHTRWEKLTDQDLSMTNSHHDQLNNILQERYSITKKEAENQIQRYIKAVLHR